MFFSKELDSFFSAWEVGRAVFLSKYSQLKGGPSEISWNEVMDENSSTEPNQLLLPDFPPPTFAVQLETWGHDESHCLSSKGG